MKKVILVFLFLCMSAAAFAKDEINTVENGTKLKCTGEMINGSIDDYKSVVDYYTIENNKIYSRNLIDLYGNINKEPKKVLRLKITDDKIIFKDKYTEIWAINYKWVRINRHTGEYTFNAKRDLGTWYRKANVRGKCTITD